MSMNKLEELELLIKIQKLSIGTSTHDNIEVYCKDFRTSEKESQLETQIVINVRKVNWKKAGKHIENLLYAGHRMRTEIEEVIIAKFKETIKDRIIEIRKQAREVLGIPEEKHEEGVEQEDSILIEGGTGNHEINN